MKFYRFNDYPTGDGVMIREEHFELVKETKCGYWIKDPDFIEDEINFSQLRKRWVSKTSRKRFAFPRRLDAIESFIARKSQQIRYMNIKKRRAIEALEKGQILLKDITAEEYEPVLSSSLSDLLGDRD